MTDILFLCQRARASTRCGGAIDSAVRYARQAQLAAQEAGLRPTGTAAIDRAVRDLEAALTETETHRRRLLRKADRKDRADG